MSVKVPRLRNTAFLLSLPTRLEHSGRCRLNHELEVATHAQVFRCFCELGNRSS